ncbi:MAG: LCP family protein, partial [Clostridia bacterium]|nr:LCP family protein [Clostridia bacterium]
MNFIGKHKVLTSVFIVIVALVILVTGTASYFFGKINITDRNSVPEPATTAAGEEISDLSNNEKKAFEDADSKIKDNLDNSKTWCSDDVMNIALLGIDYGDEKYPYGRSDAMIVLSINKAVKKVNVISLSRTVYSAIPGYKNTRMNHAHGYGGAPLALKTIELNYKFVIDNYVSCGFDSFMKIIDILGGVDIDLSQAEVDALKEHRPDLFEKAGRYTLDGDAALRYARL